MKNLGTYGLLTPQIYGFSKKQSTDPRIPDNTCVIFDEELYEKLHEYAFEESDNPEYDELIHGLRLIFMRHPVLWLTMYRDMRVWNRDTFAHHLATNHGILLDDYIDAKRNKDIVLLDTKSIVYFSHADGDGDLAPLFCLKRLPDTPDFNPMIPCQEELEWNQSYYDDEFSADNVMNKPLVYKLHFTPYTEKVVGRKRESGYITFLNNARKAKGAIGTATNDGWCFAMICEIGLNMSKTLKGKQLPIIPISQEEFKKFTFVYNRGLQDFVMNSVKHDEGGGKNFDLLYLHNFAKLENQKPLFNILSDNLGLSKNEIAKLFSLITWCSKSGVLSGCKSFLRIYNKGIFPTKPEAVAFLKEHESFIQQNTFFGELVKPMYDIVNQISVNRAKAVVKQAETLDSFEAEMAALLNGK